MHFGGVELVEQHGSTRSSRHGEGRTYRVVSRRDVTRHVEIGLMVLLYISISD